MDKGTHGMRVMERKEWTDGWGGKGRRREGEEGKEGGF